MSIWETNGGIYAGFPATQTEGTYPLPLRLPFDMSVTGM